MKVSMRMGAVFLAMSALVAGGFTGCGSSSTDGSSRPGGTQGSTSGGPGGSGAGGDIFTTGGGPSCSNLECKQVSCAGGGTTSLSGTVYDPKGKVPLYNVVVYVPNAPVGDIADGATCDQCGSSLSGDPLVTALTDTKGQFLLENVPVTDNLPLVIQVGKWRRQITIPTVAECTNTPIPDTDLTRLPRNKSEGHIPKIALSTGGADPLECLLRKIGLDDSEFSNADGAGRVNLFAGVGGTKQYDAALNNGASFQASTKLWESVDSLMKYDIVLMACEGGQNSNQKPASSRQAMVDYAGSGGRIFASHWHNYWMEEGPDPWPQTADFNHQPDLSDPFTAIVDQTFPKGAALAEWLVNVGGSNKLGDLVINQAQHTVDGVNNAISRRWIYSDSPLSTQYFTFNTPIGVTEDKQCGRVVFSDIHVSSGDKVNSDFPSGCTTTDLSAQEKALLFMLFDLSACVQSDDQPPIPPPN